MKTLNRRAFLSFLAGLPVVGRFFKPEPSYPHDAGLFTGTPVMTTGTVSLGFAICCQATMDMAIRDRKNVECPCGAWFSFMETEGGGAAVLRTEEIEHFAEDPDLYGY